MLGHLTQMAGFIISPCRLYPMQDETVFENVCLGLATGQLFTFIGAFTWKFLDHICIHLTITRVGISSNFHYKTVFIEGNVYNPIFK